MKFFFSSERLPRPLAIAAGARNPRIKTNFTNCVHNAGRIKTTLYRLYTRIEWLTRGGKCSRVPFANCLSGDSRF
jgi:hypothetical protein